MSPFGKRLQNIVSGSVLCAVTSHSVNNKVKAVSVAVLLGAAESSLVDLV